MSVARGTMSRRPKWTAGSRAGDTAAPPSRWMRWTAGQERRETILLAVVAAGAVAVTGIWWADTPGRALHSAGDRLTAAGRITGLVGTYGVLVQVVLMARLPWLDRFLGSDRLALWHRLNGGYTTTLLVAHAVLIVIGYAGTDRTSVVHETSVVIRSYPDMLAATVGLLLLVAVGVTSARAARRRLRYETWYFIHLYVYLAIALSFAHELATGNDFITHPLNRLVWVLLYVTTFALLIVYRLLMPLLHAQRYQLRVANVVPEPGGAVSVYMTGRCLERLQAEAGQFFRWRFLRRDSWWQSHPFSLSAAPNPRFLRLTAKGVGDHSQELRRLRRGTRVMAEGPYGNFTQRRRTRAKVLLIAGGVGITPLRAMLETLPAAPGHLTLVYRARDEDHILFRAELDELAQARGVAVHYVLGHRDQRPNPLGPVRLQMLVPDIADHDVYLCGPPGMIDMARTSLRSLGLRRNQIHSERFEL